MSVERERFFYVCVRLSLTVFQPIVKLHNFMGNRWNCHPIASIRQRRIFQTICLCTYFNYDLSIWVDDWQIICKQSSLCRLGFQVHFMRLCIYNVVKASLCRVLCAFHIFHMMAHLFRFGKFKAIRTCNTIINEFIHWSLFTLSLVYFVFAT